MTTAITVEGMSCEHCEHTVEQALRDVPGVSDARADHEAEHATIESDPDSDVIVRAVEDTGYDASV